MKPNFSFCGYPITGNKNANPGNPENWVPCGDLATPGHAYCDRHGMMPDPFSDSGVSHPWHAVNPITGRRRLTEAEIVARAAAREEKWKCVYGWIQYVTICGFLLLVFLTEPVRSWSGAHWEFFVGVVAGSLAQTVAWGRWRIREGK